MILIYFYCGFCGCEDTNDSGIPDIKFCYGNFICPLWGDILDCV